MQTSSILTVSSFQVYCTSFIVLSSGKAHRSESSTHLLASQIWCVTTKSQTLGLLFLYGPLSFKWGIQNGAFWVLYSRTSTEKSETTFSYLKQALRCILKFECGRVRLHVSATCFAYVYTCRTASHSLKLVHLITRTLTSTLPPLVPALSLGTHLLMGSHTQICLCSCTVSLS